VLGAHAVERREHATEHVVERVHRARTLERPQIRHVLHDDEDGGVAPGIAADRARVGGVDVAAGRAHDDTLARDPQRIAERTEQLLALLDEMERGAPRRARPETRETGQELDQTLDFGAGNGLRHQRSFRKA
jgi:hypothetical protein